MARKQRNPREPREAGGRPLTQGYRLVGKAGKVLRLKNVVQEPESTIAHMIPKEFLERWDVWDYFVFSPSSLDDLATVVVVLKNQNGTSLRIELPVGRATKVELQVR